MTSDGLCDPVSKWCEVEIVLVCDICAYADRHGSWPASHHGTHCRTCHASWSSKSQFHCVQCHRQFSSDAALRLHQPIGTTCIDPASAVSKVGVAKLVPRIVGNCSAPVWGRPTTEALKRLRSRVSEQTST